MFNIAIHSHVPLIFNQCIIRNQHFVHTCHNFLNLDEWKEFFLEVEAVVMATRTINPFSSLYPMSDAYSWCSRSAIRGITP